MKSSRLEEDKNIENGVIKDIRNLFRLRKENEANKNIVIKDIRNLFEYEEEQNYYKPLRVGNFWSNNYIEYQSSNDRIKTISVEECLRIRSYLKNNIINNLKHFDTWKIQLTIAINFISSKDNDEEHVMH